MTVRALSSTSATLAIGQPWDLCVSVSDADGTLVDAALTVTVTLPGGTTATPTAETVTTGVYRATYSPAVAGRFLAHVAAAGYGVVDFAAFVSGPTSGVSMPTVDDWRDYSEQAEGDTASWTDEQVQDALDAESAAQRAVCRVGAIYPADLREALLRRVERNLFMRSKLAATDGDFGPVPLPGRDPEIRRLEGPHRKLVTG